MLHPVTFHQWQFVAVGAVKEKFEKPSRYRRKKGLRQLFNANKNSEDSSN